MITWILAVAVGLSGSTVQLGAMDVGIVRSSSLAEKLGELYMSEYLGEAYVARVKPFVAVRKSNRWVVRPTYREVPQGFHIDQYVLILDRWDGAVQYLDFDRGEDAVAKILSSVPSNWPAKPRLPVHRKAKAG